MVSPPAARARARARAPHPEDGSSSSSSSSEDEGGRKHSSPPDTSPPSKRRRPANYKYLLSRLTGEVSTEVELTNEGIGRSLSRVMMAFATDDRIKPVLECLNNIHGFTLGKRKRTHEDPPSVERGPTLVMAPELMMAVPQKPFPADLDAAKVHEVRIDPNVWEKSLKDGTTPLNTPSGRSTNHNRLLGIVAEADKRMGGGQHANNAFHEYCTAVKPEYGAAQHLVEDPGLETRVAIRESRMLHDILNLPQIRAGRSNEARMARRNALFYTQPPAPALDAPEPEKKRHKMEMKEAAKLHNFSNGIELDASYATKARRELNTQLTVDSHKGPHQYNLTYQRKTASDVKRTLDQKDTQTEWLIQCDLTYNSPKEGHTVKVLNERSWYCPCWSCWCSQCDGSLSVV